MPPKGQQHAQADTQVSLKTLTTILSLPLNPASLENFQTKLDEIIQPHKDTIEIITRDRLKAVALDKGLIYDPEALNEKQKKDAKFMAAIQKAPTTMNSETYFQAFTSL